MIRASKTEKGCGYMNTEIKIRHLNQFYGQKQALKDVDLTIGRGMFGLLGRNGAGKTTLMKVLATLLPKSEGKISICGVPVESAARIRSMTGYLPQEFSMYPNMTVYEAMDYLGVLSGLSREERKSRIPGLLRKVNLLDDRKKKVKALSGGMKRRLGIAQAILHNPKVLIVDEPTAGLDPAGRNSILQMIRDLHAAGGLPVIMVSHSMDDISTLATRLVVMSRGELVMTGTPREVFTQQEKLRSIGLGVPQAAELTHALIAEGFDLPGDLYTLDEVCHAILALKKEGRAC